jgi:hypothetical protein
MILLHDTRKLAAMSETWPVPKTRAFNPLSSQALTGPLLTCGIRKAKQHGSWIMSWL